MHAWERERERGERERERGRERVAIAFVGSAMLLLLAPHIRKIKKALIGLPASVRGNLYMNLLINA